MAIRTNGNITGKLTSGSVNLKGTLSNAVIEVGGTNDYNQLENLPDLSVYALTEVTYEKEHETSTYQYRQDEYAKLIGSIDTKAEDAKAYASFVNDMMVEKADKEHNHDNYATTTVSRQSIIESGVYYTQEYSQEDFAKYLGDTEEWLRSVGEVATDNVDRLDNIEDEVLPNKADKEHTHEGYLTEHQDISHLASTTYVDNAINSALGDIETSLDEIIGEEE